MEPSNTQLVLTACGTLAAVVAYLWHEVRKSFAETKTRADNERALREKDNQRSSEQLTALNSEVRKLSYKVGELSGFRDGVEEIAQTVIDKVKDNL